MAWLDSQWLSPLANLFGLLGGLLLLYVGAMRFLPPVQKLLLLRPLSWRRARRAGLDWTTWRHLRRAASAHLSGRSTSPGELLGDLLRLHEGAHSPTPWTPWRSALESCLAQANAPDTSLVAARLIVPEQVQRLDSLMAGTARLLARFDRVVPVSLEAARRPPEGGTDVSAATFATALSGAAVLVDAGGTRSACADSVLVWPNTTFRDDAHEWRARRTYRDVKGELVFDEASRVGDYNGRLLELRGVSLSANSLDGEVSFVLETSETSYKATEPPATFAAKGLSPRAHDPRVPVFRREDTATYRRDLRAAAEERTCPMTSYVSLMTRGRPIDGISVMGLPREVTETVDILVLCRRSAATRNGAGTLSATAGGVVELDQGEVRLDTDDLGAPAVTESALRETTEELGIPSSAITLSPAATFVATVDGRRDNRQSRGAGQVVASVLHIGTTSIGLSGLLDARHDANAARGGFEVDSLEGMAMLPGADGLRRFARTVREQAARLDQHGLLTCFYAALRFYPSGVVDAFSREFELPWWAIPWTDGTAERVRVVRDVRQILPDDASLIEGACPHWDTSWSSLSKRLGDLETSTSEAGT